jgi:hypothetical protein
MAWADRHWAASSLADDSNLPASTFDFVLRAPTNDPSELRFGIDTAAVTREAEEEMGQTTRFAGFETTGLKFGDVASCDTFQSARF